MGLRGLLDIKPSFAVDWSKVANRGVVRLYGDYWLGNIIEAKGGGGLVAIDWELSRPGIVFEDFAIAQLWICREFENGKKFWDGYGEEPDAETVSEFLKLRCLEFLATTTVEAFRREKENGFYHDKANVLLELK